MVFSADVKQSVMGSSPHAQRQCCIFSGHLAKGSRHQTTGVGFVPNRWFVAQFCVLWHMVFLRLYGNLLCHTAISTCRLLPRVTHLSVKTWTIFATAVECKADVDRCLLDSGLTSAWCPCHIFFESSTWKPIFVGFRGSHISGALVLGMLVLFA